MNIQGGIFRSCLDFAQLVGNREPHIAGAIVTEIDNQRLRDGTWPVTVRAASKVVFIQNGIPRRRRFRPVIHFARHGGVIIIWFFRRCENQFLGRIVGPQGLTTLLFAVFDTLRILKHAVFTKLPIFKFEIQASLFGLEFPTRLLIDVDRINWRWRIARRVLIWLDNRCRRRRRAFGRRALKHTDMFFLAACMNIGNRLVTAVIGSTVTQDLIERLPTSRGCFPLSTTKKVVGLFRIRLVENPVSTRRIRHSGSS